MGNLSATIAEVSTHSATCGGRCVVEGEVTHSGLAAVVTIKCTKCAQIFRLQSSKQVSTSEGKRWLVNIAAVLGQMSTGGGVTALNSFLALMGVPGMPKSMFIATERLIGDNLHDLLVAKMAEAGQEEKRQAIERGDYHQGVLAITVVGDGGWSKRSHKHSYNAKSGVAVIFGQKTKKLLFLAVRNKFCSVCKIAENKGQPPREHRCYRNWAGSSGAMESDMLAEGFRMSERSHGVRYLRLVADGDSSVMATIRQTVPYGPFVEKIECANHACKGYRSRLEKLATDHPEFCRRGGLTKRAIQRLTVGARVAIKMHSKTQNIQQLRHDLRNGPDHVFGFHQNCNPGFCTQAAANQPTSVPSSMSSQEDSTLPSHPQQNSVVNSVHPLEDSALSSACSQDSALSSVHPYKDSVLSSVHPQEDSALSSVHPHEDCPVLYAPSRGLRPVLCVP